MHPLNHNLRLPLFQAPMFLLSGPAMVIAACKAGVLGSFPTPNCRTTSDLERWLQEISGAVNPETDAAWAVNLMMHRSNSRRFEDLELAVQYRAPLVISALGSPKEAVDAVHGYGGRVFADVINPLFARKALDAGVDGLVLVAAGAGGHTGQLSAFAFVEEVRQFWDGDIVLGGGISSGRGIRAAEVLGATYAYMGTRFIATEESMADPRYKQMVVDADGMDIVCSDSITGVKANWLRASLEQFGMDPDNLPPPGEIDVIKSASDARRWSDIWAAGQGVGAIHDVVSIADLVDRLVREYRAALEG
jgi:nitronate monooxygenase